MHVRTLRDESEAETAACKFLRTVSPSHVAAALRLVLHTPRRTPVIQNTQLVFQRLTASEIRGPGRVFEVLHSTSPPVAFQTELCCGGLKYLIQSLH